VQTQDPLWRSVEPQQKSHCDRLGCINRVFLLILNKLQIVHKRITDFLCVNDLQHFDLSQLSLNL